MLSQTFILPVAALLAVLALIWLIQFLVRLGRRHTALGGWLPPAVRGTMRLRLVEQLVLDPRRRVVLLTCDGTDVLLLIGGPSDVQLTTPRALHMGAR